MPTLARLGEVVQRDQGSEETCATIYLDSAFHAERIVQRPGARSAVQVFEGKLTTQQMNELQRIVASKKFNKLKSPRPQAPGAVSPQAHLFQVTVPRLDGIQDLQYPNEESRKKAQKTIGPLLAWWAEVWKHMPPPLKKGTSSRCHPFSVPPPR